MPAVNSSDQGKCESKSMKIYSFFTERKFGDLVPTASPVDEMLATAKIRPVAVRKVEIGSALREAYENRPLNTIFMFVFFAIVLGLLLYGASCIAPTIDPGHS